MNDLIRGLNNISDAIIDNIINTPDAEILKEVEEDHGDPLFLANKAREILDKARIKAGIGKESGK